MLPSTSCREPGRSQRVPLYLVATLLIAIVLLAPAGASPRPAEGSEDHLAHAAIPATVLAVDGSGAGGPLAPRVYGVLAAADPPAAPDAQTTMASPTAVQVTSATSFYDVEGADVRSLLTSLRQRGPSDGHGTWAASTSWVFRWSYQPALDPACRVQAARVNLDLAYTYPRWNAPEHAAPAVSTAWTGYLARVELHEHGHRDIAEAAANDLARALEALPAQPTCEALADAARASAAELLARHAQAQVAYDRETGHGATQGAILHE